MSGTLSITKRHASAIRHCVVALAFLCAGSVVAAAGIKRVELSAADCAARDLELVIMLEEWGDEDAASERLAAAGLTLMRAREACHQGRFREALALYDSVLLDRFAHIAR